MDWYTGTGIPQERHVQQIIHDYSFETRTTDSKENERERIDPQQKISTPYTPFIKSEIMFCFCMSTRETEPIKQRTRENKKKRSMSI